MSIDLDLDNKCIKIDGVEYAMFEKRKPISDFTEQEMLDFYNKLHQQPQSEVSATAGSKTLVGHIPAPESPVSEKVAQLLSGVSNGDGFEIVSFVLKISPDKPKWLNQGNGRYSNIVSYGFSLKEMLASEQHCIHSVRRNSDNTVWSVEDKCVEGQIKAFTIAQDNSLTIKFYNGGFSTIRHLSKKAPVDDGGIHFWNHIKMVDENTFVPVDDVKVDYKILQFKRLVDGEIITRGSADDYFGRILGEKFPIKLLLDNPSLYPIETVYRLSDGVVFSVGDEIKQGKIEEIYLSNHTKTMYFTIYGGDRYTPLRISELTKKPSPSKAWVDANIKHLDNFKTEPTLTDKTISYQELEQQINLVLENKNFLGNEKFGAEFMAAKLRLAFKPKS